VSVDSKLAKIMRFLIVLFKAKCPENGFKKKIPLGKGVSDFNFATIKVLALSSYGEGREGDVAK
jgi:hypothetical protein